MSWSCSAGALVLTLVALFGLARLYHGFHPMKTRPTAVVIRLSVLLEKVPTNGRPVSMKLNIQRASPCVKYITCLILFVAVFFEVKDARVKVVAAFGMAFLRNKNGAAVEQFFKPLPHPRREQDLPPTGRFIGS